MRIDRHIQELLFEHDCVILPGLGGFVANYRSAEIHMDRHTIYPPSKAILFNRDLQHNDGLLINHIARRNRITYKEAERITESYIRDIRRKTEQGDPYRVEELGSFFQDPGGRIQFRSEVSLNFLTESYGLSYFTFRPPEHSMVSRSRAFQDRGPEHPGRHNARKWILLGAGVTMVAALILIPATKGWFGRSSLDYSTLTPPIHQNSVALDAGTGQVSGADTHKDDKTLVVKEQEVKSYHLIAGSFVSEKNAELFRVILRNKGFDSEVLSQDGSYYRVSLGQYKDRFEAIKKLHSFRQLDEMEEVWLLTLNGS